MIDFNKVNCKKGFHKFIDVACKCGYKHCEDCGEEKKDKLSELREGYKLKQRGVVSVKIV